MHRGFWAMFSRDDFMLSADSKPTRHANKRVVQDKGPKYHFIAFIWSFVGDSMNCNVQNHANKFIFFFQKKEKTLNISLFYSFKTFGACFILFFT